MSTNINEDLRSHVLVNAVVNLCLCSSDLIYNMMVTVWGYGVDTCGMCQRRSNIQPMLCHSLIVIIRSLSECIRYIVCYRDKVQLEHVYEVISQLMIPVVVASILIVCYPCFQILANFQLYQDHHRRPTCNADHLVNTYVFDRGTHIYIHWHLTRFSSLVYTGRANPTAICYHTH